MTADKTVTLSTESSAITMPASVTVLAGQQSATFQVGTSQVFSSTNYTVTASSGSVAVSGSFTVTPGALGPLTFTPSPIVGEQNTAGTVRLEKAAPAGGAVVSLSSDNPALTVPASVTVPAGAYAASFTAHSSTVTDKTFVFATASYSGDSTTTRLLLYPQFLGPLTFNPSTIAGGQTSAGLLRLNLAAPSGGAVVSLIFG